MNGEKLWRTTEIPTFGLAEIPTFGLENQEG
jgi:hypothetical protein